MIIEAKLRTVVINSVVGSWFRLHSVSYFITKSIVAVAV